MYKRSFALIATGGLLVPAPLRAETPLTLQWVASGLTNPLSVAFAPDDRSRMRFVEQSGDVRLFKVAQLKPTPVIAVAPFLTSSDLEHGLPGMPFPRRAPRNATRPWAGQTVERAQKSVSRSVSNLP